MRTLPLTILLSMLLLIGCTSGPMPQRIYFEPQITSVPRLPSSIPLSVEVRYPQQQLKIGTLADRFGNETTISVTDGMTAEFQRAAINTLNRMGVQTSASSNARLVLTLDQVTYFLRSDGVRRELVGEIRMSMNVNDGRRSYSGKFEAAQRQEVLATPNEQKSREFMNEVATDLLTQAFNDPEFTRYLIQGSL